jgi:GNAT superfamily N-acetyltransferase
MSIIVREAIVSDADVIAKLLEQLGYPSTTEDVAGRLGYWSADHFSKVLVADDGRHPIGFVALHAIPYLEKTGRWARVESLVVDEAAGRTGAGRILIQAAEDIARRWNCLLVEVTFLRHRRDAFAFYHGMGFADSYPESARFCKTLDLSQAGAGIGAVVSPLT